MRQEHRLWWPVAARRSICSSWNWGAEPPFPLRLSGLPTPAHHGVEQQLNIARAPVPVGTQPEHDRKTPVTPLR
jgi:hypothetical protein